MLHDFPEPKNYPATFHPPPKRIDQLRYEYDRLRISSSGIRDSGKPGLPRRRVSLGEVSDLKRVRHKKKIDMRSAASVMALKVSKEQRLRKTAALNEKEAALQQKIK